MSQNIFIAHIRKKDQQAQLLKTHLVQVQALCESYGKERNLKYITGLAGLLHDLGKYSNDFQDYLRLAIDNPSKAKRGSVDHSTAGGKLLYQLLHVNQNKNTKTLFRYQLSEIVGDAIIAHHNSTGLKDFVDTDGESPYLKRVMEKELPDFEQIMDRFYNEVMTIADLQAYIDQAVDELISFAGSKQRPSRNTYFLLMKFIYSCLIDGDRTNTMQFEINQESTNLVDIKQTYELFDKRLTRHMAGFKNKESGSKINRLRNEMSEECAEFASHKTGIYTLSIPTGGGKTMSSLRFALKHALLFGKKHIIYVVPFTTIIDQNAQATREVLKIDKSKTQYLLEYHSNFIMERNSEDDENQLLLTRDNWDSAIIYTTMVQFLDVIYGRGTQTVRKFHNLTDSIIIFDEVQRVPTKCISMFNEALNYLKKFGNTTSLLCTATQPALSEVRNQLQVEDKSEIIQHLQNVIDSFQRVEIKSFRGGMVISVDELVDFIIELQHTKKSVLVILNTKKIVKEVYKLLKNRVIQDTTLYHLSTGMCPAHRNESLENMKELLNQNKQVICISSQLIESGVDISFESVIRSSAGLDSIAQAAGRCNRNGEQAIQPVYVVNVNPIEENVSRLPEIQIGKNITNTMLKDMQSNSTLFGGNLLSNSALDFYFTSFVNQVNKKISFDYKEKKEPSYSLFSMMGENIAYKEEYNRMKRQLLPLLFSSASETIAKNFAVIDNNTTGVIVPYEGGQEVINDLNGNPSIEELPALYREAQQFTINLYSNEVIDLANLGVIQPLQNGQIYSISTAYYTKEYGFENQGFGKLQSLLL